MKVLSIMHSYFYANKQYSLKAFTAWDPVLDTLSVLFNLFISATLQVLLSLTYIGQNR